MLGQVSVEPLPEVTDVDHATLIGAWDDAALERGKQFYNTVCFACHGIDGKKVTVEGARAFAVDPLARGTDPYSLFKVITFGYATMPQQQWMTPEQRYDVVHYIREAFLKTSNPSQYRKVDAAYLDSLPKSVAPNPGAKPEPGKKEKDFGPVLCTNLDRDFGAVLSHRLPGGVTVSYDIHRMNLAGVWTGGFLDLENTRFHRQRGEEPAQIDGTPVPGLQTWKWAYDGSFEHDLPPRAPAPEKFMRYFGHYLHGDRAVMSYSIADTRILELPEAEQLDERPLFRHTLALEPGQKALQLCVAELDEVTGPAFILPAGGMQGVGDSQGGDAKGTVAVLTANSVPESVSLNWKGFAATPEETLDGLVMGEEPFCVAVRFRTDAGGTLVSNADPKGKWGRDGKSLYIDGGGRLIYDIGWLGAMKTKRRVNDGKWHRVVLGVENGTARLYVDGLLEAERKDFARPHVKGAVFKIGSTAKNFGGNWKGEIEWVRFFDRDLPESERVSLAKDDAPSKPEPSFEWPTGEKTPEDVPARDDLAFHVAAAVLGETDGLSWEIAEGRRLVLHMAPSAKRRTFQILRRSGTDKASLAKFGKLAWSAREDLLPDPRALTTGGANRFPQPLTVSGSLGKPINGYALDTIPIPFDNPYNAWLRTSALGFFDDGRCAVGTYTGDIWIVSGIDQGLEHVTWQRFASGMYEPFGVLVIDGLVYVTCRDGIKRLHDLNNDGYADYHETFFADPDVSTFFHAFCFDLQRDGKGNLYYAKSGQYTSFKEAGAVLRVAPDGRSFDYFATGFRTPNGMGMMPNDLPLCSDNEGNWMPASKISLCRKGGFYGYVQTHSAGDRWAPDGGKIDHRKVVRPEKYDQPILWLPVSEDNSSGSQLWVDDARFGPLSGKRGRLMHSSFGKGWLYYLMLQEVDGVMQSACVTLPHQWEAGVQRLRTNPVDGQLYGVGLSGWQGPRGGKDGCLQRLRYAGGECRIVEDIRATANGVAIRFNFELDPAAAADPGNYNLEMWNYEWHPQYGSPFFSVREPGKRGADKLVVSKVRVDADGKGIVLDVPDLVPCDQLHVKLRVKGGDGEQFDAKFYQTIHRMPGG